MQERKGKEEKKYLQIQKCGRITVGCDCDCTGIQNSAIPSDAYVCSVLCTRVKGQQELFLLKSDIHWWCIFFTILSYPVAFLDATQLCRRKAGTLLHLFDCRPEIAWISSTAPTFVFGTESSHWVPHHLLLLDRIKPSGQELLLDSPDRPNPGTYNTTLLLHCASNLLLEPRKKPGRSSNQRKHIFIGNIALSRTQSLKEIWRSSRIRLIWERNNMPKHTSFQHDAIAFSPTGTCTSPTVPSNSIHEECCVLWQLIFKMCTHLFFSFNNPSSSALVTIWNIFAPASCSCPSCSESAQPARACTVACYVGVGQPHATQCLYWVPPLHVVPFFPARF